MLRLDLDGAGRTQLDQAIEKLRAEHGVHVLKRGSLEHYLPQGYHSKDIDKLVDLLSTDYWPQLPEAGRFELEQIATALLAIT